MAPKKIQELLTLIAYIEQKVSDKTNITEIKSLCDQITPLYDELIYSLEKSQDPEIGQLLLAVKMYLENIISSTKDYRFFNENNFVITDLRLAEKSLGELKALLLFKNLAIEENDERFLFLKKLKTCGTFKALLKYITAFRQSHPQHQDWLDNKEIKELIKGLVKEIIPSNLPQEAFKIVYYCIKADSFYLLELFDYKCFVNLGPSVKLLILLKANIQYFKLIFNLKSDLCYVDPPMLIEDLEILYNENWLNDEEKTYITNEIINAVSFYYHAKKSYDLLINFYEDLLAPLPEQLFPNITFPSELINTYNDDNFTLFQTVVLKSTNPRATIIKLLAKNADINKPSQDDKHILYFLFKEARELHKKTSSEFIKIIQKIEFLIKNGLKLDYPQAAANNLIYLAIFPYPIDELVNILLTYKAFNNHPVGLQQFPIDLQLAIYSQLWQEAENFENLVQQVNDYLIINKENLKQTSNNVLITSIINIVESKINHTEIKSDLFAPPAFLNIETVISYLQKAVNSDNYFWVEILLSLPQTPISAIGLSTSFFKNCSFSALQNVASSMLKKLQSDDPHGHSLLLHITRRFLCCNNPIVFLSLQEIILSLQKQGFCIPEPNIEYEDDVASGIVDKMTYRAILFLDKKKMLSPKNLQSIFNKVLSRTGTSNLETLKILSYLLDNNSLQISTRLGIGIITNNLAKNQTAKGKELIPDILAKIYKRDQHISPIQGLESSLLHENISMILFFINKFFSYLPPTDAIKELGFLKPNLNNPAIKSIINLINYNYDFWQKLEITIKKLENKTKGSTSTFTSVEILSSLKSFIGSQITLSPKTMVAVWQTKMKATDQTDPLKIFENQNKGLSGFFQPNYMTLLKDYMNKAPSDNLTIATEHSRETELTTPEFLSLCSDTPLTHISSAPSLSNANDG